MENSAPSLMAEIKIGSKTRSDYNQLALCARWLFYHFISNSGSWNNCYIFIMQLSVIFLHVKSCRFKVCFYSLSQLLSPVGKCSNLWHFVSGTQAFCFI